MCVSHVWLFVTPWTVARQALLSMEFSRQEYWCGLPFPFPGDLPDPGIEPRSPALQADILYYTTVVTIIIILSITSLVLMYLFWKFVSLDHLLPVPSPSTPISDNHKSDLFFIIGWILTLVNLRKIYGNLMDLSNIQQVYRLDINTYTKLI